MRFIARLMGIVLLSTSQVMAASSLTSNTHAEKRELYRQALAALDAKQHATYRSLKKKLPDYPLYPYLLYNELIDGFNPKAADDIRDYLAKYSDVPLSDRLLSKWLSYLARKQQWQTFLDFYQPDNGITLQCHHLQALIKTGKQDQAMPEVSKIWLHERSRPKACDPVFKLWQDAGLQTDTLTWQRISLALEANQLQLARYLARSLPDKDRASFVLWLDIRKHPEKLKLDSVPASHPFQQEVYADGIIRLSRRQLEDALALWDQLKIQTVHEPELIARVERTIALQFLDEPQMEHFDYLVFAEPCESDTKLQEIRIRAALLHESWRDVIHWIDRLPAGHRDDERWLYWQARALEKLDKKEESRQLFEKVAMTRSFYGFMAADRLKQDYQLNHSALDIDDELLAELSELPAVQRTFELIQLDSMLDARREWYALSQSLEETELLALARIAHDWQWHDRAIMTLAKAKAWNDLSIRFPVRYQDSVMKQAGNHDLDPAWIYAMMRQESAFMHDARSSVGALGLMQLMPKTASSVARKLKQPKPRTSDIIQPDKNIELGSAYLKQVYDRFDQNPVLAIAAYNAGPHRVNRWLPETGSMPADIWIELVPFRETRNYLKSVLAYTVIYADKLEQDGIRMQDRMPEIPAQSGKVAATGNRPAG